MVSPNPHQGTRQSAVSNYGKMGALSRSLQVCARLWSIASKRMVLYSIDVGYGTITLKCLDLSLVLKINNDNNH